MGDDGGQFFNHPLVRERDRFKAERDSLQHQLGALREELRQKIADRFTYLAQHSSAPGAWHAALLEVNQITEEAGIPASSRGQG